MQPVTESDSVASVGRVQPTRRNLTPYGLAWRRLRKDLTGMVSLSVIVVVIILVLAAPLITRALHLDPYRFHPSLIGEGSLPKSGPFHSGISSSHPLGVEPGTGRDVFARLLYGARLSLMISALGTLITVGIGVLIGMVAAFFGRWVDAVLGRIMDLILSVPQLVLLIALNPVVLQVLAKDFGLHGNTARVVFIVVTLSVVGWPYISRIIRGEVLRLREREFVEAALANGSRSPRVLAHELLPNLWVPIIVYATLLLPVYIAVEAALSFLGVGIIEPTADWGKMLADSVTYYQVDPLYLFIPGVALFVVVLAFNLLGDSVRDALDPSVNRR